ncbi:ORF6N domain-containing protein [Pedobacter sp. PAMC26386]|nr:ORF6N domain-containing protein [Pedobacter sp. PAMC26386]
MENKELDKEKITEQEQVTDEMIMNRIYLLRGQKVMIDVDLVKLYQLKTAELRTLIGKNAHRFAEDFIFKLNREDELSLMRQDNMIRIDTKVRVYPYAFTEQGLTVLSGLLKSVESVEVNKRIIRIFALIRSILPDFPELYREMNQFKERL